MAVEVAEVWNATAGAQPLAVRQQQYEGCRLSHLYNYPLLCYAVELGRRKMLMKCTDDF